MTQSNECAHGVVILGAERTSDSNHYDSVWRCENCREVFHPATLSNSIRAERDQYDADLQEALLEIGKLILASSAARWRPIDQAPLDGRDLLLGWRHWSTGEWTMEVRAAGNIDDLKAKPGTRWLHGEATHWMPLPQPPQPSGDKRAEKSLPPIIPQP